MKTTLNVFVAVLMFLTNFDVRTEQAGQVRGADVNLLQRPSRVRLDDGTTVELNKEEVLAVNSPCVVFHYVGSGVWFEELYVPPTTVKVLPRTVNCVLTPASFSHSRGCKRKGSGKSIALIQPQYPHGGKKQTYLPTGVLNFGSRLKQAGVEVDFIDLNRTEFQVSLETLEHARVIGITVLGPSYIPEVIKTIRKIRQAGLAQPILVGGQGVSLLQDEANFSRWFDGLGAIRIKEESEVAGHLGVVADDIPSEYQVSLVPMLEKMPEEELRAYLTTEFSLFLGQGCKFNCAFCSAMKARKEQYREWGVLEEEVSWICKYLASIGHDELRAYLSNLDGFQTPDAFEKGLATIKEICDKYGITPHLRCLATSRCTFDAYAADRTRKLFKRLRSYGLEIVALGADGADEQTWEDQNKPHNDLDEIKFISTKLQKAGIAVELLMVIGFQTDTFKALWRDFKFSLCQAWQGRIIRPYLAKSQTPSGRWEKDDPLVKAMVADSDLLTRLDYAMIGSKETHPKLLQRIAANGVYLAIIGLLAPFQRCPTRPLVPVPKGFGRGLANLVNRLMPFDR